MQLKSINSLDLCPLCLRSFKCQFPPLLISLSKIHSHENSNTVVIRYHPHKKSTEQLIKDSSTIYNAHTYFRIDLKRENQLKRLKREWKKKEINREQL